METTLFNQAQAIVNSYEKQLIALFKAKKENGTPLYTYRDMLLIIGLPVTETYKRAVSTLFNRLGNRRTKPFTRSRKAETKEEKAHKEFSTIFEDRGSVSKMKVCAYRIPERTSVTINKLAYFNRVKQYQILADAVELYFEKVKAEVFAE